MKITQQKCNEYIKLANSFRDRAYTLHDVLGNNPGLSLIFLSDEMVEMNYCWDRFEYYAQQIRNYYKK
jgi:hypothetical protein